MRKRVLVTAGGTAIAWHLGQVARQYFQESLDMRVCDINEPYLVAVSALGIPSYQVPLSSDPRYLEVLGRIVEREKIEILVPLLPIEIETLGPDSDFVRAHGLATTAPKRSVVQALSDKGRMRRTLSELNIDTPEVYRLSEIDKRAYYCIKPALGFGSAGVTLARGEEILNGSVKFDPETEIIQEDCRSADYREVTVEIFNGAGQLRVFARERVAVKAGVCVKTRPVNPAPFTPAVERLTQRFECPRAFNLQFLYHDGVWKLFDCNLRLGAGSALSTAIGFQLTRAFWADLLRLPVPDDYFQVDRSARSVLRVYQEVVAR